MNNDDSKLFTPMPQKHWWAIRNRLKSTIPPNLSADTLASWTQSEVSSARANIIPTLVKIGLIDKDNKTDMDFAARWRDDKEYPKVCKEILNSIFPQELIKAFPIDSADKEEIKRWFSNKTKAGSEKARSLTSFYQLLLNGDPSEAEKFLSKSEGTPKKTTNKKTSTTQKKKEKQGGKGPTSEDGNVNIPLQINIQIQISPDSTLEQIEKIFESMEKHLGKFKG